MKNTSSPFTSVNLVIGKSADLNHPAVVNAYPIAWLEEPADQVRQLKKLKAAFKKYAVLLGKPVDQLTFLADEPNLVGSFTPTSSPTGRTVQVTVGKVGSTPMVHVYNVEEGVHYWYK